MHSWEVVGLVSWNDQSKEPSGVLIFPLQPPTSLLQRQSRSWFSVFCAPRSVLCTHHISVKDGPCQAFQLGLQAEKVLFLLNQELFSRAFPGGSVLKNQPADAGDVVSIPGPGRSHTPQSNQAHALQLLKPVHLQLCSATREATAVRSLPTRAQRVSPAHHNQRKPTSSNEDPAQPKIK